MGNSKSKSTRPSCTGQTKADRQFDPGEISILRAYFRLPTRKSDPALKTLYVEPYDRDAVAPDKRTPQRLRRPIRLVTCDSYGNVVSDLNHAVARICLSDVQRELPQWIDASRSASASTPPPRSTAGGSATRFTRASRRTWRCPIGRSSPMR
ncbi:hypothetical protein [Azohydromonas sediminis]|uniref:hypothetical protein n=1 Tax=Azohydromonas sediminis TaxID=2259674 RepID=UPI001F255B80|nr:hypothetical protein [Azohydromonas sediminis]